MSGRPASQVVMDAIRKRLALPEHHARLSLEASLRSDLGLSDLCLISIACDIEEELLFEFAGAPEERWVTVEDVIIETQASAGAMA